MFKVNKFIILLSSSMCIDLIWFGKTVALLVIFGCALGAPTPRVDEQPAAQDRNDHNNLIPGNTIKELESSLDEIDAIFKNSFGKIGMY